MQKTKQLNINNTFHSLNFNVFNPKSDRIINISKSKKRRLDAIMKDDNIDKYTFVIESNNTFSSPYFDYVFNNTNARIVVTVSDIFPVFLLFKLGNRRNLEVMYNFKQHYTDVELTNMDTVSKVYNVSIYIKVKPSDRIAKFLFSLFDLRYTVAFRAYFDFTQKKAFKNSYYSKKNGVYDKNAKSKAEDFKVMHECLARWRIQCHFGCVDENSYVELKELVKKVK